MKTPVRFATRGVWAVAAMLMVASTVRSEPAPEVQAILTAMHDAQGAGAWLASPPPADAWRWSPGGLFASRKRIDFES